ncbi:MAG: Gfo/Idh/MocA family protein [bacterium]
MNHPIGVAVIGAGILGLRHARVYAEQSAARLLAVVDSKAAKACEVAEKYNARWFTDYHEMISALGPAGNGELQAVSVATPDHLHVAPVRDCLLAGLEVFVEKPLTMSVVEANELIALARERSRVLVVNYSQRWLPEHQRVEEFIKNETLGKIAFIESHRWDAAWVPERMISWAAKTTPIHFMSSHDIDLILHWLDDRVDSVSAVAHYGALAGQTNIPDVVDGYAALLHFRRGTVASLHSSWILPSTFPAAADAYLEIFGAKGAIWLKGNDREMRLFADQHTERNVFGGPVTATESNGRIEGAFTESLKAFLRAVENHDMETPTSAARTLHVVEVQEAILKSAASGQVVKL